MRTARLAACLVVAGLLLTPMLCLGGGRSKSAVLIVSRSRNATEESVAKTLAEHVFRLLERKGLAETVPILSYHFERPEERDHCMTGLKIGVGDLPCAAVVELDSRGIPLRVKKKYPNVAGSQAMASTILSTLERGSSPPVAGTPVARPSATPVIVRKRVPMRPDAGIQVYFGAWCNTDPPPPARGYRIDHVVPGCFAANAGLRVGDILLRIGNEPISDMETVWSAIWKLRNNEEFAVCVVRNGRETSWENTFKVPDCIRHFEIVEGRGLPGYAEIGDHRSTVIDHLGKPDTFTDAKSGGMWANYNGLGVDIRFNSEEKVEGVRIEWPFVGQTSSGVPTSGKKVDIYSAYGKPSHEGQPTSDKRRLIWYESLGIMFILDAEDDIVATIAVAPARKKATRTRRVR